MATISGTPSIINTTVSVFGQSEVFVSTNSLTDTASSILTTGISHFCGEYKFSLLSTMAVAPALVPAMVSICDSDCGYYDYYRLASLKPTDNTLLGLVPFTLEV